MALARSAVLPSSGTGSRSAISAISGSSSWRTRLRRNRGSRLLGSTTGSRPSARHTASVSARRRARIGWRAPGAIAPNPAGPAPRSRFNSTVSAWSSAVWPVMASGPSTARRASRDRCSRSAPGSTWTRSARKPAPRRVAASSTTDASSPEPGRRPWSTWTAVTASPVALARTRRHSESAPPETAATTPPGPTASGCGKAQRARSPAIRSSAPARPASPLRPRPRLPCVRSTGSAPGSRRWWGGSRARSRPGRTAPDRRTPRRR